MTGSFGGLAFKIHIDYSPVMEGWDNARSGSCELKYTRREAGLQQSGMHSRDLEGRFFQLTVGLEALAQKPRYFASAQEQLE